VVTVVFAGGGTEFDADAYIVNQLFDEYEARAVQSASCDPADQILSQMFLDVVGRPLDGADRQTQLYAAAIDAINQRLTNQQGGATIYDVYLAVEILDEAARRAVNGVYTRYLRRPAQPAELATYAPIISQDTPIEELAAFLVAQAGYCDPQGFVGIGNIVGVPPAQQPPELTINSLGGGGDVIITPGPPLALQVPPMVAAANAATRVFQARIADDAAAIAVLNAQVATETQAVASANQNVNSVVLALFGFAADQNAATAARGVAAAAIQKAIAPVGASNIAVVEPQ